MDSLDPKLFQEYIHQAFGTLERKEKVFLEASDDDSSKSIGEIKRLIYLLQRLARAVRHPGLYGFLEVVTNYLEFSEENWGYLSRSDREGLLELYDSLATTFKDIGERPHMERFCSRPEELFIAVKGSVAAKKSSLSFNLGAQKKNEVLSEFEEIQKLSKDLEVFGRGVSAHHMPEESKRHLNAITGRLSKLADQINLLQVSELFEGLERKFSQKGLCFGFYGEKNEADRRVIHVLEAALTEALEKAFFATDEENPEIYLKASDVKGCLKIEAQLNRVNLPVDALNNFEENLESMGFQTHALVDEHSGTCIEALAPKTLNSIEGQVIESWGGLFALDMRYVKDCFTTQGEAFFKRRDGQLFLNSELGQLPVVDLGIEKEDLESSSLDIVVLEMDGFQVAIPAQKIHRRQSLSMRGLLKEIPPHKYYKAVCLLENSSPALLLNAKSILKDFQKAELKYSKYIEINCPSQRILICSSELVEITPYEKVTRLPTHGPMTGLINYEGEPIIVHSLEDKLGLVSGGEFRHILICRDSQGPFGLAVGSDISVSRRLKEEAYSEPAFSASMPKNLIEEIFYEEGSELFALKIEALRDFEPQSSGRLKKVA